MTERGLKNINVFYSIDWLIDWLNVYKRFFLFFLSRFLRFLTFFYFFFWNVFFTSMLFLKSLSASQHHAMLSQTARLAFTQLPFGHLMSDIMSNSRPTDVDDRAVAMNNLSTSWLSRCTVCRVYVSLSAMQWLREHSLSWQLSRLKRAIECRWTPCAILRRKKL